MARVVIAPSGHGAEDRCSLLIFGEGEADAQRFRDRASGKLSAVAELNLSEPLDEILQPVRALAALAREMCELPAA